MQDGAAMCDKTCNLKHHIFCCYFFKGEGAHTMKRVAIFTTVNVQSCPVGYNLYAGTEPRERRHEAEEDMKQEMMVCVLYDSFNKAFKHTLTY